MKEFNFLSDEQICDLTRDQIENEFKAAVERLERCKAVARTIARESNISDGGTPRMISDEESNEICLQGELEDYLERLRYFRKS